MLENITEREVNGYRGYIPQHGDNYKWLRSYSHNLFNVNMLSGCIRVGGDSALLYLSVQDCGLPHR